MVHGSAGFEIRAVVPAITFTFAAICRLTAPTDLFRTVSQRDSNFFVKLEIICTPGRQMMILYSVDVICHGRDLY